MAGKKKAPSVNRRTFIKMSSGAAVAVSANWFLPRISLGAEDVIRLGAVCELTGPVSIMGTELANGLKLGVDTYNKAGGVLGKEIKLFIEDTESKKDIGLAKARRLVERNNVHFLTGIIQSTVSMAIQMYTREKKLLFVNSNSGNDALINPPYCGRYFFKCYPSLRLDCLGIREPAKRIGPKWFFLADNYSWGKSCIEYFKKSIELVRPDFENVGEVYPTFGETNYAPFITKIMAAKPDGLGIANYGTGWARIIKQSRQMGLKCHIHQQFWALNNARAAGDAVLGITASSVFWNEDPEVPQAQVFSEAYKEKYGHYPGASASMGFHSIHVIMEGVKAAGTMDTEAVIDTMENMIYKDSIISPIYHFRKADHQPINIVRTIEAVKDPKYTYGQKLRAKETDPKVLTTFLKPEEEKAAECGMTKKG